MRTFSRDGLTFDLDDLGPADATPVVLLHGFPQGRACWAAVAPLLADAGLRVLVPDQRGYSSGARPTGPRAYRFAELVGDVVALLDAADAERAHVVGHDWGGAVAWAMATRVPDRMASLTAVSTPHPAAMMASMIGGGQLLKSWYVAAVQAPWLPEQVLAGAGRPLAHSLLVRSGLDAATADTYLDGLSEPGAASAALAWYRALAVEGRPPRGGLVDVPTLHVWSDGDVALGRPATLATARYVRGPYRLEILEGVSHWIPEQQPERLAALVVEHAHEQETGLR